MLNFRVFIVVCLAFEFLSCRARVNSTSEVLNTSPNEVLACSFPFQNISQNKGNFSISKKTDGSYQGTLDRAIVKTSSGRWTSEIPWLVAPDRTYGFSSTFLCTVPKSNHSEGSEEHARLFDCALAKNSRYYGIAKTSRDLIQYEVIVQKTADGTLANFHEATDHNGEYDFTIPCKELKTR